MADREAEPTLDSLVFDRVSIPAYEIDRDGTIMRASRYAEELAGSSLTGRRFTSTLVDFASEFDLEDALAPPGTQQLTIATRSGLPETFVFHFAECEGGVVAVGEYLRDDNEMLRATLLGLNNEINELNRKLQKQNVELAQLNDLKSRFIGVTAHDLRNPIGGIHQLAGLLLDEAHASGNDEHVEIFTSVRDSTGFMLELIEDLLGAVTIESGAVKLNLEPTDINELIAASARRNRIVADARGVGLDVRPADDAPLLCADRLKTHQVLNNLISNAVKFSRRGSSVSVAARRDAAAVEVSVADEGPGIPASDLDKLFQPFQQASVRNPDGEPSSGLGLFIAKAIVEQHGGRIRVESRVGVGTTFRFSLPLANEASENEEKPHDEG
ncbi:MAG: sensor histidine kinase [Spirochaetota bacterium]